MIPVILSPDLERSLRFWLQGLGLRADRRIRHECTLVGWTVHNRLTYIWLNERADGHISEEFRGMRLIWAPDNFYETTVRLKQRASPNRLRPCRAPTKKRNTLHIPLFSGKW